MKSIECVGLIVVRDRKLLLAFSRNKQAWYLPGGKVDAGETLTGALQREIREELSLSLAENDMRWYYHITAPAFGEAGLLMQQNCFMYDLHETPQPTSEIADVRYFSLQEYEREIHQVKGVLMAFEKLRQDGWVD